MEQSGETKKIRNVKLCPREELSGMNNFDVIYIKARRSLSKEDSLVSEISKTKTYESSSRNTKIRVYAL